jgi:hypothetical protein
MSKGQRSYPLIRVFLAPKSRRELLLGKALTPLKTIVFSLVLPKVLAYTPA